MEYLREIFTEWTANEILDKVAENRHFDLMQKLNKEYHKKLRFHSKYKNRYSKYKYGKNKLFNKLALMYNINWLYYEIFMKYKKEEEVIDKYEFFVKHYYRVLTSD